MPVQMIGDILAAELSHMQPYIRFCSCQINGAALLQTRIDNEPDFKNFLKVGRRGLQIKCETTGTVNIAADCISWMQRIKQLINLENTIVCVFKPCLLSPSENCHRLQV